MRRCAALAAALVWCTVVANAGSAAAAVARQTGFNVFTSSEPGSVTGSSFRFGFVNPENPSQKPHTVTKIVVRYPAGTVFDFGAAPQCTASDAQLQSERASACPPDTKLRSGLAVSDTGSSGGFPPRY